MAKGQRRRAQPKTKKVWLQTSGKLTDLERNIAYLEQKEELAPIEKIQLVNLKERQIREAEIKGIKTPEATEIQTKANDNMSQSKGVEHAPHVNLEGKETRKKQGFLGAFLMFKNEKITQAKLVNPSIVIDKDFAVDLWKAMSQEEKKVYHDKASREKKTIGSDFRKDIKNRAKTKDEKKVARKVYNQKQRNILI